MIQTPLFTWQTCISTPRPRMTLAMVATPTPLRIVILATVPGSIPRIPRVSSHASAAISTSPSVVVIARTSAATWPWGWRRAIPPASCTVSVCLAPSLQSVVEQLSAITAHKFHLEQGDKFCWSTFHLKCPLFSEDVLHEGIINIIPRVQVGCKYQDVFHRFSYRKVRRICVNKFRDFL